MSNFTKQQFLTELSNAFDLVTSSTINLTDQEKTDCFNKMLDVAKTLDPAKGNVTVKY